MGNDTAVRVSGLRKRYGDTAAVDGIDLEIARGEVFALLGPNGAGKTTTVEILEGFRRRDGGTAEVLGEDPGSGGRLWRARIGTLSGGQARRVDVALGIVGRPELLFLDEPTTGFDPQARRQFWELIRQLADGGVTVLLTTHYLEEAEALAGRLAVLAGGRVVAIGEPSAIGGAGRRTRVSWDTLAGRRSVQTATPTQVVGDLARQIGGEVPGLTVTRRTLEDAYLELIGDRR
jgi:ABC-2 type transport system ATP-binding protein